MNEEAAKQNGRVSRAREREKSVKIEKYYFFENEHWIVYFLLFCFLLIFVYLLL